MEDCYRREIEHNGQRIMLEIIDTAGTEQFTSMVELYIKNCQGFLLVYDITKKSTFEDLENIKKKVWEVKKSSAKKPAPMLLLGNKADCASAREVNIAAGASAAKEWGALFFETSAKDTTNVEGAFHALVDKMGKKKKSGGGGGCVLQ